MRAGTIATPEAKLRTLIASGAVALSGKPHGGTGRGYATLVGKQFTYSGNGKLSKTLSAAVDQLHDALRGGILKIQRAVRQRVLKPVKARNDSTNMFTSLLRGSGLSTAARRTSSR